VNASTQSNTTTNTVDEVIDMDVTWADATAVSVKASDTDKVLTFTLTNTGNATESFSLAVLETLTANDDFNPSSPLIYLESGAALGYQPGTDPQYVSSGGGQNHPVLAAEDSITIYVVSDIPINNHLGAGNPVADGDTGDIRLTATSRTLNGSDTAPGDVADNQGECGNDAVFIHDDLTDPNNGNSDSDIGTYVISNIIITAVKSFVVSHPDFPGLTEPIPGSIIAYTIVVTASGSGTATNVIFTDPIPANTTYVNNSLFYNDGDDGNGSVGSTQMTDAYNSGDDAGDVNESNPGEVTVNIGSMTAGSAPQDVRFKVTIQ
jgi:uncharacterized repeat protein (TIGR01451 family)